MAYVKRARPISRRDFVKRRLDNFHVKLPVVTTILVLIGWAVYSLAVYDHNTKIEPNRAIARYLLSLGDQANDLTPAAKAHRIEAAGTLLDTRQLTEGSDFGRFTEMDISANELAVVEKIKATGEPEAFDTHTWTYIGYFRYIAGMWWMWLGIWLLYGLLLSIEYREEVRRNSRNTRTGNQYVLADLPWKKPWPWLYSAAFGPVWASVMLFSYHRTLKHLPNPAEVRRRAVDEAVAEVPVKIVTTYHSSPVAARKTYVEFRGGRLTEGLKGQLRHSQNRLDKAMESLKQAGETIRDNQALLNTHRAEIERVNKALVEAEKKTDAREFHYEFDRITQLPGVIALQSVNNGLRVVVRVVHPHGGLVYDFGDWQIDLGTDGRMTTRLLRSGVREGWSDYHDRRVYPQSSGRFCYGDRGYIIEEHCQKGQFLEALALIVECLRTVRDEEQGNVPYVFNVVDPSPAEEVSEGAEAQKR